MDLCVHIFCIDKRNADASLLKNMVLFLVPPTCTDFEEKRVRNYDAMGFLKIYKIKIHFPIFMKVRKYFTLTCVFSVHCAETTA